MSAQARTGRLHQEPSAGSRETRHAHRAAAEARAEQPGLTRSRATGRRRARRGPGRGRRAASERRARRARSHAESGGSSTRLGEPEAQLRTPAGAAGQEQAAISSRTGASKIREAGEGKRGLGLDASMGEDVGELLRRLLDPGLPQNRLADPRLAQEHERGRAPLDLGQERSIAPSSSSRPMTSVSIAITSPQARPRWRGVPRARRAEPRACGRRARGASRRCSRP